MFFSNIIIIPFASHTRFHAGVRSAKRSGIRVADHRIDAGRSALGNRRGRGRGHGRGHRGPVSGRCYLATRSSVQPVRHVLDADRRPDRCQGKCVAVRSGVANIIFQNPKQNILTAAYSLSPATLCNIILSQNCFNRTASII